MILFFFSSFELTFFQQHSQYQTSNLVKKLMKMSENIVVLRRDTKNILRKFSKMKKRISFLKRRIITNESQLKRFLFLFFFHSFFDFFFDFFFVCLISFFFHHHYYFICSFFHHHIYFFSQFIYALSLFRSLVNSFVLVFFVERIDRFRV
jgi:magnesium-transporting ATPase (P-type)